MNISRPGGFPLCAETLGVLNDNSEMFSQWLKEIPLKNRQAVVFGNHLLVCQNLQKRWVKLGTITAASTSQCKLVFNTATHDVEISLTESIPNVWEEETANIVDETSPGQQWTLLGLQHVFELKLWYDWLPSFEAGLPGGFSIATQVGDNHIQHGLDTITSLTLYGDGNKMVANSERARMKLAVRYQGQSTVQHVLQLPIPFDCPDGVRMDADVEMSGKHYPIEVYTDGGALMVCVGRWLKAEGLMPSESALVNCDAVIRINREVVL